MTLFDPFHHALHLEASHRTEGDSPLDEEHDDGKESGEGHDKKDDKGGGLRSALQPSLPEALCARITHFADVLEYD